MTEPPTTAAPAPHPAPLFAARAVSAATIPIWILAVVAIGFVLKAAQSVVIPLVIAWLLAYVLTPPVNFLTRRCRIPSALSVTLVILVVVLLAATAGAGVQQRLVEFTKKLPAWQPKIAALVARYVDEFNIPVSALAGFDIPAALTDGLLRMTRVILSAASTSTLAFIFLFFMLLSKPFSGYKLRAAFPTRAAAVEGLLSTISRQIATYLGSLFFISAITGFVVWGALLLLGVEFAFAWGLLAFVLNFIPTVGSIVASIPPVLTAMAQHPGTLGPAAATAAVLFAIQFGIGNLIAPKIYGDRLNLSPVTILLFLLFWGWLWGIPGALLAVPLAATIQITLAHIPDLVPLATLMGSSRHYAKLQRQAEKADSGDDVPADAPRRKRRRHRRRKAGGGAAEGAE